LDPLQPAQQFVMSEPDPPAVESSANTTASNTSSATPSVDVPAPFSSLPTPTVALATNSATAIGLGVPREEIPANPFAGGLDIPSFVQCKQLGANICRNAKDTKEAEGCFKRMEQPVCKQFVAFATITGMSPKDDIDFVKHYKQLDLIHLVRFGANYPGIYYSIGSNGDLVDLVFGPQTGGLDIRKNIRYPEIATRFPNVMLFSIVDKLPKVQPLPGSDGLQLILRFQLLNGCHACERAGFADVLYNFSAVGALQSTAIQSMEPAS